MKPLDFFFSILLLLPYAAHVILWYHMMVQGPDWAICFNRFGEGVVEQILASLILVAFPFAWGWFVSQK